MTGNELLKADILEILFEHRNKLYGAYTLRKFYNNRLGTALTIALSSVLVLLFVANSEDSQYLIPKNERSVVTVIEYPRKLPIEKPVEKMQQKAPLVAQQKFIDNIKIEEDKKVTELMPDIKSLDGVAISDKTIAGAPAETIQPLEPGGNTASGSQTSIEKEAPYMLKERAPEFPGGQEAWISFLKRYLQAPADLEAGEKKTVFVRFLVSSDGTVTHFEVQQSAGSAFDNEVIRVLKKMPKWKPAVQNGNYVSVTFTQPVTFVGIEE